MSWLESPIVTNALLLALLLVTLYRAPLQRLEHKVKRGCKRLGTAIGTRVRLWREHRRRRQ